MVDHKGGLEPFYDREGIVIFCGDCRAILPALERRGIARVDMVLADPPYGDTELAWDERDLAWLSLSAPLLAPSGSVWCFGSFRMFMVQASEILRSWKVAQEVVWEKHNGSGFASDRFRRVHEHVLQLYPRRARWDAIWKDPVTVAGEGTIRVQTRRKSRPHTHLGHIVSEPYVSHDGGPRLMRSVIHAASCHGTACHPTQKPVEVLAPLIRYSCPPGGVVLDPTMGSGSTLLAALVTGRRAIGIERSREDCEAAVLRLRGADVAAARRAAADDPRQTSLF